MEFSIKPPSLQIKCKQTVARQRKTCEVGRPYRLPCNGCELEIHALSNAFYDLERFGLRFVASPRHADVLMVTGPVTKNMREALQRTYAATPDPKWIIAVGDCAYNGGMFAGSYACVGAVSEVVPVDLHIRGCPPDPVALLRGLITLVEAQK